MTVPVEEDSPRPGAGIDGERRGVFLPQAACSCDLICLSLRVAAIFFAMITLAVASAFQVLASQLSWLTGGEDGRSFQLPELLRPGTVLISRNLFGFEINGRILTFYLVFAISALMILALLRVVNSPFGRVLQAIRENRFRAEALGFRTVFHLTYANCLAALVAAGAAYKVQFFSSPVCDASGSGEGKNLISETTVTAGGDGRAGFTVTVPGVTSAGQVVTATATDPEGNTSEFSACAVAQSATTVLQFSSPQYSVNESGGSATITVSRAGGVAGAVSVTYATSDHPTLSRVVLDKGGAARFIHEEVVRRSPGLAASLAVPGDGYLPIDEVRAQAGGAAVVNDPERLERGSYVLVAAAKGHRQLLQSEPILVNLTRHLAKAEVTA